MRELWLYLRCVFHNEVTFSAFLFGSSSLGLTVIAAEFGMLWVGILLIICCICVGIFIFSGAALNTFYSYAVTAAAIGGGAGSRGPVQLSPALRPSERAGAELACKDLGVSYT